MPGPHAVREQSHCVFVSDVCLHVCVCRVGATQGRENKRWWEGEKNAPSYLVSALPLMWEELEVMRRKNVMSFDVLWNISCLFLFKRGRFSQYGAARMSRKLLLIVVPTDDHCDFLFLTKPKKSNHSNSELESTNTAEKKRSEITIRLSCKVSWGRRKNLLLKNGVYGWPRNNKRAKIMNTRKSFKSLLETCASLYKKKKKSLHHFFFILFKTKTFFFFFPQSKSKFWNGSCLWF